MRRWPEDDDTVDVEGYADYCEAVVYEGGTLFVEMEL